MSKVIEINDDNYEAEVLRSAVPVLMDFWGEHCGPCRILKPVLSSLSESLGDKAKVVTVDVAVNQKLFGEFGVTVVPTLIVMKEGKVVARMVGLKDLHQLQEALGV